MYVKYWCQLSNAHQGSHQILYLRLFLAYRRISHFSEGVCQEFCLSCGRGVCFLACYCDRSNLHVEPWDTPVLKFQTFPAFCTLRANALFLTGAPAWYCGWGRLSVNCPKKFLHASFKDPSNCLWKPHVDFVVFLQFILHTDDIILHKLENFSSLVGYTLWPLVYWMPFHCYCLSIMALHSLTVLNVPLNPNQPTNQLSQVGENSCYFIMRAVLYCCCSTNLGSTQYHNATIKAVAEGSWK